MAHEGLEFHPVERCMLCGAVERIPQKGVAWKGVAYSYSLCGLCGLKYMDPRPTLASYARFFRDDYWQQNLAATGFPTADAYTDKSIDQLRLRMPKYEQNYAKLRRDLTRVTGLTTATRVLEVGCAFGYSLEWLNRDFGCQVFGVEPSTEAVKRCRRAPAIRIVGATAEEVFAGSAELPTEAKYDVIFFRHCLEELSDSRAVLRRVRDFLSDSGLVLVYTANVEYYDAMSPVTQQIFSPETITRLLATCGLKVFRLDAPRSPTTRRAVMSVLAPSYEMAVFARRGELSEVEHPQVDPTALLRAIALGNAYRGWCQLGSRDLWGLLKRKARVTLSRS